MENGWPRDEEAGERLVDDLGAAQEEDVVALFSDGVEGPVGIVDADRSLGGSAGGGNPDRAAEIGEQASWAPSGDSMSNPGLATAQQRMTPPALTRSSTGPARAMGTKPTMTAAASANIDPRDRAVMGHLVRCQEGMPTFGISRLAALLSSIATVVIPVQAGIQGQSHLGLRK